MAVTPTPLSEYGQTWRLKVSDGASTPVFNQIAGEVTFDWTRSSKEIDLGTKDDGAYGSSGFGTQTITISPSGKLKLPDANGLERLSNISKTVPPTVEVQICKGSIVKFQGIVSVGNFSTTHPNDDTCTWKCDLKNVGAPTIDSLGASS